MSKIKRTRWKPSFPESMTAVQACELAHAHWVRMAKDPAAAKKRGERPGVTTCALCKHASIRSRLAIRNFKTCESCLTGEYEHPRDLPWLCSVMYSHANDAFNGRKAGWEKRFRAAARPIIKRLWLMVWWAKREAKDAAKKVKP